MMPSTTTGVTCRLPASGTLNSHAGASRPTVVFSICVSVV